MISAACQACVQSITQLTLEKKMYTIRQLGKTQEISSKTHSLNVKHRQVSKTYYRWNHVNFLMVPQTNLITYYRKIKPLGPGIILKDTDIKKTSEMNKCISSFTWKYQDDAF